MIIFRLQNCEFTLLVIVLAQYMSRDLHELHKGHPIVVTQGIEWGYGFQAKR
jgi:hypothetical protein